MWDEKNILGEQRVDFKGGKTNFFFWGGGNQFWVGQNSKIYLRFARKIFAVILSVRIREYEYAGLIVQCNSTL